MGQREPLNMALNHPLEGLSRGAGQRKIAVSCGKVPFSWFTYYLLCENSVSPVLQAMALATRTAERRQGAMRIELLWAVGCRRLEVRYVGAARVAVLLDGGELVKLLVLPARPG